MCLEYGEEMENSVWMNKALIKISQAESGDIFVLKDLFEGIDWNSLSKGERQSFGRYFKNEVNDGRVAGVGYYGKAPNNSAKYIKY